MIERVAGEIRGAGQYVWCGGGGGGEAVDGDREGEEGGEVVDLDWICGGLVLCEWWTKGEIFFLF